MLNFRKLKNQDIVLIVLVCLISGIGLATVFSTTFYKDLAVSNDFKQQVVFFLVGILVYLAVIALDSSFLNQPKVQVMLVVLTTILLVALLFFGERISGTKRWFVIAGVSFQPSEFAKLIVILSTAATFATTRHIQVIAPMNIYKQVRSNWKHTFQNNPFVHRFLFNMLSVLVIVSLIRAQPSLGNSLLTLGLWILMLLTMFQNPFELYAYAAIFAAVLCLLFGFINLTGIYDSIGFSFKVGNIDLLQLCAIIITVLVLARLLQLKLTVIGILVIAAIFTYFSVDLVWNHALTGYQQDRIVAFLNPDADPLGAQWQVNQAKIAIGSGQIFGKGFLNGTQSNLGLLPFAYTDFAYAAYTEQFGLVGSLVLLGLYYLLILRIFNIASACEDNFGRLVCIGVGLMLSLNIIVNVGMNLGIMPVTGVPLPFISYGGSAVLVNFIGIALVQMIYSEHGQKRQSAEMLLAPDNLISQIDV